MKIRQFIARLKRNQVLIKQYHAQISKAHTTNKKNNTTIDVIVPVYRGLQETKNCLTSILENKNNQAYEIIVIDDVCPEQKLSQYLKSLANKGKITLIRNDKNLGFVHSVNIGMCVHPDRDVILLNSDTVVANDWIDRLRNCAYSSRNISSVSPLSNSGATICAFPITNQDNPLFLGATVKEIDAACAKYNSGVYAEAPTTVGFCMFIRRASIKKVGVFDTHLFGRGYGEENDFCMRASYLGWRHLLCASVFVQHIGGVSFMHEKEQLCIAALRTLQKLHPDYLKRVSRYCIKDPLHTARLRVIIKMLQNYKHPKVLFVYQPMQKKHYPSKFPATRKSKTIFIALALNERNLFTLSIVSSTIPVCVLEKRLSYKNMILLLQKMHLTSILYDSSIGPLHCVRYNIPFDLKLIFFDKNQKKELTGK